MRNIERWTATKTRIDANGRLRTCRQSPHLGAGSTLVATLAARWYRRALEQHARGTLVELGGGRMPYYHLYASKAAEVWCTDWPQTLHQTLHTDLFCDLDAPLPLRECCADTLIAADVLEHLYRPQELLREMWRILRPGGVALVNTPFMYWVHEAPHDYFRFTQHAMARMAREAGFEPLQVDPIGGALCVLADIAGKLIQRLPLGAPLARALQQAVLAAHAPIPRSESSPLLVAAVLRRPR